MTPEEFLKSHPLEEIFRHLGVRNLSESDGYFRFSSPFREDRDPSMVCYKENAWCIDFGGSFRGSVFTFAREAFGTSLYRLLGESYSAPSAWKRTPSRIKFPHQPTVASRGASRSTSNEPRVVEVKGKTISAFPGGDLCERECERRGITQDFWDFFGLKFCEKGTLNGMPIYNRLLIPVEENEKILSWEARDVTRTSAKKVLYPKGGTMNTLFNIDHLSKEEPLVVVEGIMDLPKLWTHVTKNCTATFGIQLTRRQRTLLNDFPTIILLPDSDSGGERFIDNLDSALDHEFLVGVVPSGDPGDAGIFELRKAVDSAVSSTEWYVNRSELFNKGEITWTS